jgi:hypothetical protein
MNEQTRAKILEEYGGEIPHVLPRDFCIYVIHALAKQLETELCNNERMPWVTSTIEQRSDGFSLHVTVLEPTNTNDATIL